MIEINCGHNINNKSGYGDCRKSMNKNNQCCEQMNGEVVGLQGQHSPLGTPEAKGYKTTYGGTQSTPPCKCGNELKIGISHHCNYLDGIPMIPPPPQNDCAHLEAYERIKSTKGLSACECEECFKMVTEFDGIAQNDCILDKIGKALVCYNAQDHNHYQGDWRDKHYRAVEKMLNDFKNKKIGYTDFIDENCALVQSEKDKSREEECERLLGLINEKFYGKKYKLPRATWKTVEIIKQLLTQ